MTTIPKIGTPPKSVASWLRVFATDNLVEAARVLRPTKRAYHRGRHDAFVEAADLVRRSYGKDGDS